MPLPLSRGEAAFREAFERLKCDKPEKLAYGTPVSQNNVAKEAGRDPSALRKSRYPELIQEIQTWIKQSVARPPSRTKSGRDLRLKNASRRARILELKAQRDHIASLLAEADATILDLTLELNRLKTQQAPSNISPLRLSSSGLVGTE